MSDKTINLAPAEWNRLQPRSGLPSSVITAMVVVALIVPTLRGTDPHVAEATQRAPRVVLEPWNRIEPDNPAHTSFGRLEGWHPWHEILAHVARSLGPEDGLEYCSYSGEEQTLEITGVVRATETVAGKH